MAEPLKNLFNTKIITVMGNVLLRNEKSFDREKFVNVATQNLEALELKERSAQIRQALMQTLPSDYRAACELMVTSLHPEDDIDLSGTSIEERGIRGWAIMPMAELVAGRGLEDFDFSLDVLREFTKRFTSEFAVRPFFLADTARTLEHFRRWATDKNYHIRRLASEGSRPRLPWALRLPEFVKNPEPVLHILEELKDDPSDYVRRSVANNLNDIAKDHPDRVAGVAGRWLNKAGKERTQLVRHACRTLIKQGHEPTLRALGYSSPAIEIEQINLKTPVVTLGSALEFDMTLRSAADHAQPLIIDFVVHHRKANGQLSPKVFKWKVIDLPAHESLTLSKKHPMKPITTRVYYPGLHELDVKINGVSFGGSSFELFIPD
ncbi:MAG: DNA alkylation repair protein [Stappiaceae bacterium]